MDHIRKALEKAGNDDASTVRDWMQPVRNGAPAPGQPASRGAKAMPTGKMVAFDPTALEANHIMHGPHSQPAVSDRYRLLRTRVTQLMQPQGWTSLGITSPTPGAGKTVTSVNMAITFARAGNQTVILIDADIRKPSVANALGLNIDMGLTDYLSQDISLSDILYQPADIPNLYVLPGRGTETGEHAIELLNSPKLDHLKAELNGACKPPPLLIFDTPPIHLGDDDVLALAQPRGLHVAGHRRKRDHRGRHGRVGAFAERPQPHRHRTEQVEREASQVRVVLPIAHGVTPGSSTS